MGCLTGSVFKATFSYTQTEHIGQNHLLTDTRILDCAQTDGQAFSRHVCAALARYEVRRAGFNLAANAPGLSPDNHVFMVYPEHAHDLITTSLKALKEFETTGSVSKPTRERFVLEDTKDRLQSVQGEMGATAYRELHDRTMAHLNAKLTGMESLALFTAPSPARKNGF